MKSQKELSDTIGELFNLESEEFDANLHFFKADSIVECIGVDSPYIARFSDLFHLDAGSVQFEDEKIPKTGEYIVRNLGRLVCFVYLGLSPKLHIVHWKSHIFKSQGDEYDVMEISYEGTRALGIRKYIEQEKGVTIGRFTLGYPSHSELWTYFR